MCGLTGNDVIIRLRDRSLVDVKRNGNLHRSTHKYKSVMVLIA